MRAYTVGMKYKSLKNISKSTNIPSVVLAGVFVIMAVSQLFKFEEFPGVIKDMWLPMGDTCSYIYASIIVILEVFAVPILLNIKLSWLARITGIISGCLVLAIWIFILLWQNLTINALGNAGLLGATLPMPVGWWTVVVILLVSIFAVFVYRKECRQS